MSFERTRGPYVVSTDPARIDLDAVHAFLVTAYWCEGIPRQLLARAIANSLCFSLLGENGRQAGFARVCTDSATFAYLMDVYILAEHRGQGLGRWLIECVMEHPRLAGLRRFSLVTRDAHGLYRRFGFSPLANPDRHMEIVEPDPYRQPSGAGDPRECQETP
ncbi:MAG TPA: GNAT family N-acetyltransferase [Thermoanaerobaculia bacterium]|nr:GNAT family N-acetyltransferase [Thermoanaerobaculia bacterium]